MLSVLISSSDAAPNTNNHIQDGVRVGRHTNTIKMMSSGQLVEQDKYENNRKN